jgi:hypothetical protein
MSLIILKSDKTATILFILIVNLYFRIFYIQIVYFWIYGICLKPHRAAQARTATGRNRTHAIEHIPQNQTGRLKIA